jgi:hypothetical protein
MAGQRGFFDTDERLEWLSAAGDPLERLAAVVDFELFRGRTKECLDQGGQDDPDHIARSQILTSPRNRGRPIF